MPGTDTPRLFQGAFRQLNKFFVVISVNLYLTRGHYISVGKSEDFYSFKYIADKVSNNSNFSIQDESEFKKYYLKRKLEEACYNQEVYNFVINYDMGEFDNVSYSKVISYLDKMIAYNVFKQPKQKKVRFFIWRF